MTERRAVSLRQLSLFLCLSDSVSRGHDQLVRSRADVHLLRTLGTWISSPEVSLVEEVFNLRPTGKPRTICM